MNTEQLAQRHSLLNDELSRVRAEIVAVSGKILTSPIEGIGKLIAERVELQNKETGLLSTIDDVRLKMEEAAEQERNRAEEKEAKRKLAIAERLVKNPPPCRSCGENKDMCVNTDYFGRPVPESRIIEVHAANYESALKNPKARWAIRFYCMKCRPDFCQMYYPDEQQAEKDGR